MKVINEVEFEAWKANNTDHYGMGIFRYAEKWADLMESKLANGEQIKDMAQKSSHEADTEGITGYMYGAAVNILAHCWEYGEELRKWHNKDYDYEGEGTVNPAIMNVRKNTQIK